jgi:hypothetical protein
MGHSNVFKFGYNPVVQNVEQTVWDVGGIYAYPSSAVAMSVTSAAGAADNGVQVQVQGLDADCAPLTETVTLASSGTATTSGLFFRVFRARVFRAFTSGSQALTGAASITNGGVTYAYLAVESQQTLMAVYTVPAGHTAYVTQFDTTVLTETNNKFGTIRLVVREEGGVFRTQQQFAAQNASVVLVFTYPIAIPEKSDIEVRAIGSSLNANLKISSNLELVIIRNEA